MEGRWQLRLQARAKNVNLSLKPTKVLACLCPFSIRLKLSPVLIKLEFNPRNNSRRWKLARILRFTKLPKIFRKIRSTSNTSTIGTKRTSIFKIPRGCLAPSKTGSFSDDAQAGILVLISTFFKDVVSVVKRRKRTWLKLMMALAFLGIISWWILQHILINPPIYKEACFPLFGFTPLKLCLAFHKFPSSIQVGAMLVV